MIFMILVIIFFFVPGLFAWQLRAGSIDDDLRRCPY